MPPNDTIDDTLPDALRDALGRVIADERRLGERAYEVLEARSETILANLRAAMAEGLEAQRKRIDALADMLQGMFTERMATVRDGMAGDRGEQGVRGEQGEHGEPGEQGPIGPPGKDGEIGPRGEPGEQGARGEQGKRGDDGAQGPAGPSGKDGQIGPRGEPGEPGYHGEQGRQGEQGPAGARGEQGSPGERGLAGDTGPQGATGEAGQQGERGLAGPQGPEGPVGKLPVVKLFLPDCVHYAGEVVSHLGSTFQAVKDTGSAPPSKDWIPLAVRGLDARTPQVRGTWREDGVYDALDIVALNGGSFIAKRADPGPCPGDGWQLIASQGRNGPRGEPGERGEPGASGAKGDPAPAVTIIRGWKLNREDYVATPVMSDGKDGPPLDLHEMFEQFAVETEAAR